MLVHSGRAGIQLTSKQFLRVVQVVGFLFPVVPDFRVHFDFEVEGSRLTISTFLIAHDCSYPTAFLSQYATAFTICNLLNPCPIELLHTPQERILRTTQVCVRELIAFLSFEWITAVYL